MVRAGIDYSINCPCMCVWDDEEGPLSHSTCRYYFCQHGVSAKESDRRKALGLENIFPGTQMDWKTETARYLGLADWFLSIMVIEGVEEVAMEAYALGANGRVFNIAECTGTLKTMMALLGIQFTAYPPTMVKKIFSGKGNANKDVMVAAYKSKYSVGIDELLGKPGVSDSPISDIVDSHAMLYTHMNKGD